MLKIKSYVIFSKNIILGVKASSKIILLLMFSIGHLVGNVQVIYINENSSKKYENYLLAEVELARGKKLAEAEKKFQWFAKNINKKIGQHGLLRTWLKSEKLNLIVQEQNNFDVKDLEINLVFAASYLNTGKFKEANLLLEKLKKHYPQNEQVAYFNALLLVNTNRVNQALTYLENYLKRLNVVSARHAFFYFLKAKIYTQLNKFNKALESVNTSLSLNSGLTQALLLKGLLAEQLSNVDSAIDTYKTYLDVAGVDEKIVKKLVMLLFNKKQFDEAEKIFSKLRSDKYEYYFDLALIQAKSGRFAQSLNNVNQALLKNKNSQQARILKIELLLKTNKLPQAVELVSSWIEERSADKLALGMVEALKRSGVNADILISMLHKIVDKGVVHKNLLAMISDLYVDTKKLTNSLPYHKQILEITSDELLKSKTYYRIGYIYFMSNQKDKVEDVLKKAINTEEVFAPAYNLLAYYYADSEQKLEYATWLIDKALSENPKDPVFLDTKGYIAYKSGKKIEAKKLFRKALNFAPNDKIISSHMKLVV